MPSSVGSLSSVVALFVQCNGILDKQPLWYRNLQILHLTPMTKKQIQINSILKYEEKNYALKIEYNVPTNTRTEHCSQQPSIGSKFENLWPVLRQLSGTNDFGDCGTVNPLVTGWISLIGLIEFAKIEVSNGSIGKQCVTTPFWLKINNKEKLSI